MPAVKHIVLFKFKADTTPEAVEEIKAKFSALKAGAKIPGILAVSFGPTFKHDRAQGFTHALVVDLESKDALETYATHPDHVEIITNNLKPVFEAPPLAMDYEYEL